MLRIGAFYEREEKFGEAERTYLKCTRFNSADAFLSLGNLQLKLGKIDQGVENLEKANCIKRFDIDIENKLVYGYSLREETMDKALKLAHSILKKEPESLKTLYITAGILEKQDLIEQAIEIMQALDQHSQAFHIKHYLG
jgi:tetratricopeptide (TPR) repeat protein